MVADEVGERVESECLCNVESGVETVDKSLPENVSGERQFDRVFEGAVKSTLGVVEQESMQDKGEPTGRCSGKVDTSRSDSETIWSSECVPSR